MNLLDLITPELLLAIGRGRAVSARHLVEGRACGGAPIIALGATCRRRSCIQINAISDLSTDGRLPRSFRRRFANYVKLVAAGVGILLVLLAWPTNADANGSRSIDFGTDAGEFFA